MIKIAYLILTHQDAPLTIRVARKLTTNTSNHVFVHVDAKTDIKPYAMLEGMAGGRIHLLKRRMKIAWGGQLLLMQQSN